MKSLFKLLRVFFFGKKDEEVDVDLEFHLTANDVAFIVAILLVILFIIFK